MTINVVAEIVAIRERVARMEATLDDIRRTLACKQVPAGNMLVPVSLVIVLVQAAVEAIKHFA